MTISLSAVSDGGKGAILTATGDGAEWLFYEGSIAEANCIALRSQPNYHIPIASNTTYYVVVRDSNGAVLGNASTSFVVESLAKEYNFAGGTYTNLGNEASRNSLTLSLPSTTHINRVSLNCASGYPATTLVHTRVAGDEWKLSGIIGARPSSFATTATPRSTRAPRRVWFSISPRNGTNLLPVLAYLKDGQALGWIADGYTLYDFYVRDGVNLTDTLYGGADSLTDTKAAMDAAVTLDSNRIANGLTRLESAISSLKSTYPNLDQSFKLGVYPLWCRKTPEYSGTKYVTAWGSLTLAEIQSLNARGAAIDEALAGVTLLWATEAHRTVMQKYWYFKTLDWFNSFSHIRLGGFNIFSEDMVSDMEVAYTSAFKTWVEGINPNFALLSNGYMSADYPNSVVSGTGNPSNVNSHISFVMPSITFNYTPNSMLDMRKLFLANTFERQTVRGHNIELPQRNAIGVEDNDLDVLNFAKVILAAADNIGAPAAPLFSYSVDLFKYFYDTPSLRWAYDFMCESWLGITHVADMPFNYSKVTNSNDILSVAGINEYADEIKLEWFLQNQTLNLTSVDVGADIDDMYDLDVILTRVGSPLYIGSQQVQKLYIGNQEVVHLYKGSTQIF